MSDNNEMSEDDVSSISWQKMPTKRKFISPEESQNGENAKRSNSRKLMSVIPELPSPSKNENRFAILNTAPLQDVTSPKSPAECEQAETTTQTPEAVRPPPIFIPAVDDIAEMHKTINASIGTNSFTYKSGRDGQVRIMVKEQNHYRKLVKYFEEKKLEFHTYQLKQERAYRAVIKNLHYSTNVEQIKSQLADLGHIVRHAANAKNRSNKMPMSIFFIDLEPAKNNKAIFDIKRLCNAVVTIEPPKRFDDLVQCHRCQEFGHTKRFCNKAYRCVKCGAAHKSTDCTKSKEAPARCLHCDEAHTASYKGCRIYQATVKRRDHGKNSRNLTTFVAPGGFQPTQPISNTSGAFSYADVARGNPAVLPEKSTGNAQNQAYEGTPGYNEERIIRRVEAMMQQMLAQITAQFSQMFSNMLANLCK